MSLRADVEEYLEKRVREIDEELSLWFGVEDYDGSSPDVEVGRKYRTAAYDARNDVIGVSTEYVADKTILELDTVLAEELSHRIYRGINPESSSDISEFFGRIGEHVYARRYGQEVDTVGIDEVEDLLEEKTALENEARQRDQKVQSKLDELPNGRQFKDKTGELQDEIENQNYNTAREVLEELKTAAKVIDPEIILPDLENVEDRIQKLENGEIKYESVEDVIRWDIEDAGDFYADQYNNTSSLVGVSESLVSIGSENVRQHLTYAFADRHFENIEAMSPDERAELLENPENIWSFLTGEDEELQQFYQENKDLLENNLDVVRSN